MSREKPMAAVKAMIVEDGKILVLESVGDEGKFLTLPGGRIEYGEPPLEALHREVEEEVSLEIDVEDPLGMYHFYMGEEEVGPQVALTVFRASVKSGEVDISSNPADEKIVDYRWLSPEEFLSEDLNSALKDMVREKF